MKVVVGPGSRPEPSNPRPGLVCHKVGIEVDQSFKLQRKQLKDPFPINVDPLMNQMRSFCPSTAP